MVISSLQSSIYCSNVRTTDTCAGVKNSQFSISRILSKQGSFNFSVWAIPVESFHMPRRLFDYSIPDVTISACCQEISLEISSLNFLVTLKN